MSDNIQEAAEPPVEAPWFKLELKRGVKVSLGHSLLSTWGLDPSEARELGSALLTAADELEAQL